MNQRQEMKIAELEKRIAEMEYHYRDTQMNAEKLADILKLMRENGVQELTVGQIRICMPYRSEPLMPGSNS